MIESARYIFNRNYPQVDLRIDGQEATIGLQQKFLRYGEPVVIVTGPWTDGRPEREIPANSVKALGRHGELAVPDLGEYELALLALARQFLKDLDDGTFAEGPVDVPGSVPGGRRR